ISFQARSLIAGLKEPPKDILPIKDPMPPPAPASPGLWKAALAAAGILALAAAGLYWGSRRRKLGPPPEPAHVVALRRRQELGHRELESPDSVEPFYVALSEILRRYLEGRFGLPVMEQTTQEIKR